MSDGSLGDAIRARLESGGGETAHGVTFLALVTLESGTRVAIDADRRWLAVPPDERAPFVHGPGSLHVLAEALETRRADFDAELEGAARRLGLDPDALSLAFPAVELIRAVLAARSSYLVRLALQWILPSEARELRDAVAQVAAAPELPAAVKDLARRLVVPG